MARCTRYTTLPTSRLVKMHKTIARLQDKLASKEAFRAQVCADNETHYNAAVDFRKERDAAQAELASLHSVLAKPAVVPADAPPLPAKADAP